MEIRPATPGDAPAMARVQAEIVAATGAGVESDPETAQARYIAHPARVCCLVAVDDTGVLLGFQSLIRASDDNPYDVPTGWGIIGTHVSPGAARRGVGRALFAASRDAAAAAGLVTIDATMGATNTGGLAYYAAMGFRTWREGGASIAKRFNLTPVG